MTSTRRVSPLKISCVIRDLEALPSTQDIKCDDMGNWRNNTSNRFYLTLEAMDDNSTQVTAAESTDRCSDLEEGIVYVETRQPL